MKLLSDTQNLGTETCELLPRKEPTSLPMTELNKSKGTEMYVAVRGTSFATAVFAALHPQLLLILTYWSYERTVASSSRCTSVTQRPL